MDMQREIMHIELEKYGEPVENHSPIYNHFL